ncbi:diguanylate cyclase [Weizmannia acidilactici]|uniref:Putative 4-hydroxy-4-methyl-2-oxoglutarate aldolase n=1 Tax=Weizmannia acidilactici TaxID=2607726 RepID=A0A5J4JH71_9BACI|nr:RraA family protein [Weizmannia acidilactici]GER66774.1 diguanylate cyclase [Weizmannia acidilactici]GER71051.1 diguanylate cyclase [Weizmannia acidilactici]GER74316.1 diguanylate cyclase [Weizmannia acidilactici]
MEMMIEQFLHLPTTCISDAMNGMNNLDPEIKPLNDGFRLAGRAFTVKMPVGDNLAVIQAIREAKPGDVLVIDSKGDLYRAIAGDFVLGMAKTLGIQGVVVDGVIRDIKGVLALDFPVFAKGTTVAAGGKAGNGKVNVPISCGGVPVRPGDIIVGDADGVVVVPREKEEEVYQKAANKLRKDEEREAKVSGNREEILKYLDKMLQKAGKTV